MPSSTCYRELTHIWIGLAVRIAFFDPFNAIQAFLLREKLRMMMVDSPMVFWVTDYLTHRLQFLRLDAALSDVEGTVLYPFLFNLYTSDLRHNSDWAHLQRSSDDSAVVVWTSGGRDYVTLESDFVEWSIRNHLVLNMTKTKEIVTDFRRKKMAIQPLTLLGEDIKMLEDYKYLSVHIDSKPNWRTNTWGSWDPSACASIWWTSFTSLLSPVLCSMLLPPGVAALEQQHQQTEKTDQEGRLRNCLETGHHGRSGGEGDSEKNCYAFWRPLTSLSTHY